MLLKNQKKLNLKDINNRNRYIVLIIIPKVQIILSKFGLILDLILIKDNVLVLYNNEIKRVEYFNSNDINTLIFLKKIKK